MGVAFWKDQCLAMEFMEDDPPDLVDVGGEDHTRTEDPTSGLQPEIEELALSKVPITIVTGRLCGDSKSEPSV